MQHRREHPSPMSKELYEAMCLEHLESVFKQDAIDKVAAVVIEPFLGEGGYVPAPKMYLKRLRQLCTEYGIVLIFDEVQTGFGKTGHWFAYQHYDVVPDILCLAKGIASGFPLSAMIGKACYSMHGSLVVMGEHTVETPVSCAASLATIKILSPLIPYVNETACRLLNILHTIDYSGAIEDLRHLGLMIGLECKTAVIAKKIREYALKEQLIIISCGNLDTVIRLIPPLNISKSDADRGMNILTRAILHAT